MTTAIPSTSVAAGKAMPILSDLNVEDFKVKQVEKVFEDLIIEESAGRSVFNYDSRYVLLSNEMTFFTGFNYEEYFKAQIDKKKKDHSYRIFKRVNRIAGDFPSAKEYRLLSNNFRM